MMKWFLLFSLILILSAGIAAFIILNQRKPSSQEVMSERITPTPTIYRDETYGFSFIIPRESSVKKQTEKKLSIVSPDTSEITLEVVPLQGMTKLQALTRICSQGGLKCGGIDSQVVVANTGGVVGTKYSMKLQASSSATLVTTKITGPIYSFDLSPLNLEKPVLFFYPTNLQSTSDTILVLLQEITESLAITKRVAAPQASSSPTLSPGVVKNSSVSAQ